MDKVFEMVILPSQTNKKEFLDFLEEKHKQYPNVKLVYDEEHNLIDIYSKDTHIMLRPSSKNLLPMMNYIEGYLRGIE